MDFQSALTALPPETMAIVALVMLLAGFVKGAVGFAMPMVAAGGLGAFLAGQEIVALLILPTLISNVWQVFRQGFAAARETLARFWKLNLAMACAMPLSAPLLPMVPSERIILLLGVVILAAAAVQAGGWQARPPEGRRGAVLEIGVGVVSGLLGGLVAIWGPPVLVYLIALGLAKTDRIRAQGLNFMAGALILVPSHLATGVLAGPMLPLSILMTVPVVAGMALGLRLQDGMNQQVFRRVTLAVLVIAGLNLLRRGLFG